MMKLSAAASMVTAALAGNQKLSRQLADYCYYDTGGYFNEYYTAYDWSYAESDNCPGTYDYYYEKDYSCNSLYEEICESTDGTSLTYGTYTLCDDDSMYCPTPASTTSTSTYTAPASTTATSKYESSYSGTGNDAVDGGLEGMAVLMYFVYMCWLPVSILLCCLCCCGVCCKKSCWYNCYGCKKVAKDGDTIVIVQQPNTQVVPQAAPMMVPAPVMMTPAPVMMQQPMMQQQPMMMQQPVQQVQMQQMM